MVNGTRFMFSFLFLTTACMCMEHLQKILHKDVYDKMFIPKHPGGEFTVTTQLFLASIGPINDKSNTFEVVYYHRQWWNDPRITFNATHGPATFSISPASFIWIPDVSLINSKYITSVYNQARTIINPNGDIYVSQKFKAVAICELVFHEYPFDTQSCSMRLESFAHHKGDFDLQWHRIPTQKDVGILGSLSGYELTGINTKREESTYTIGSKSETYVNLIISFALKRSLMYYVFRSLLPVMLLLVLNFCCYWIPHNAVPARITLIITTFLSSMFILQTATEMTVKLSYTSPMQLFLTVHIFLIVMSLVEYIIVLNTLPKTKKKMNCFNRCKKKFSDGDITSSYVNSIILNSPATKTVKEDAENTIEAIQEGTNKEKALVHPLDSVCRVAVPGLYLIFCIFYWIYYVGI